MRRPSVDRYKPPSVPTYVLGQAGAEGAQAVAAHVEDAAEEEPGEDGHAFGAGAGDDARFGVELEHDAATDRVVEPAGGAVA